MKQNHMEAEKRIAYRKEIADKAVEEAMFYDTLPLTDKQRFQEVYDYRMRLFESLYKIDLN